jgi:hypothetical protein
MRLFGRKASPPGARPALMRSVLSGIGTAEWPRSYEAQVREAYLGNAVAQRAVRMVAEGCGGVPFYANSEDHRSEALLRATSAGQGLFETVASQLLLHGNAFVQIICDAEGMPAELYALRPERVTIEPDAHGWPAAYLYRAGDTTTRLAAADGLGRPALVHLKTMHPLDDHYGLGCLGAAAGAVAIHNAATRWNKALLDNAARPSGALVYDPGEPGAALSADQFERLRTEMEQSFSGTANAGPFARGHGLRGPEGGGCARDRAGVRRAADAAGAARRQHLRQLFGGEPGAVAADDPAHGGQDSARDRAGAAGMVAGSGVEPGPGRGARAGGGSRAALVAALRCRFPDGRREARDAGLCGGKTMKAADGASILARLMEQARDDGADVITLRAMTEEASEVGAQRALERLGLTDQGARHDLDEMRELLGAWRDAKRTARNTVVAWIVRIALAVLVLGMAVKFGFIARVQA